MTAPAARPRATLSVVIPTRDRRDRLRETLGAVFEQARELGAEAGEKAGKVEVIEVIVVDDGSRPGLERRDLGREDLDSGGLELRLERQPPSGPAAARNRGARLATGERILFLGDDTRPAPGALAAHLDTAAEHRRATGEEVGVQGHIDWDPEQPVTELMRFLAPAGPQFYFKGLVAGEPIPFTAVLGSNLSVPAAWLRDEPFDETFPHAAIEDTEAAYRWRRRGWRTYYAPRALAWHHHLYDDLGAFLARQRRAGRSARHAARRHPRLLWPLVLQPTLFGVVVRLRRLLGRGRRHDAWDLACRRALLRGFVGPQKSTR